MEFQKVKLRKDTDYVFCFKRAEVIEDFVEWVLKKYVLEGVDNIDRE